MMIPANHAPGIRPTSSNAVAMRATIRLTISTMTSVYATASAIVLATSPNVPDDAIVMASAIRNHAVTSSTAAHAIASDPIGRLIIRRSARILASTGNAVIDIATPMNSANATNFLSGPMSLYSGNAIAMPSSIGTATLVFEIAVALATLPFSEPRSTSSPTRNM